MAGDITHLVADLNRQLHFVVQYGEEPCLLSPLFFF